MSPPNRVPIADLQLVTPLPILVGQEVIVDASGTTDVDGPTNKIKNIFYWGQGIDKSTAPGKPGKASYTRGYDAVGVYDIVYEVIDHKGGKATATVTVDVQPAETSPVPVDCVLGDPVDTVGEWGPCQPDGTQTCVVTWTREILTPPANGGQACGPTSGTRIETRSCVYVPPQPGAYPYYEALTARADCRDAYPLRSQAEIDSYQSGGVSATKVPIFYDAGVDAAVAQINPQTGSTDSGQKHLTFELTTGDSLLTWDFSFDAGFAYTKDGDLFRHKTWRVDSVVGWPFWLQWKTDYKQAFDAGQGIAEFFLSVYNGMYLVPGQSFNDQFGQQILSPRAAQFYVAVNTITRTWLLVEGFGQGETPCLLSMWIADAARAPVQLYNRVPLFTPPATTVFRLEYDSSQDTATNGLMQSWNRNVVVLAGPNGSLTPEAIAPLLVQPGLS